MKQLSEDTKIKIIDLVFDKEEINELNDSGKVQVGKTWINKGYGYRQQLLVQAAHKLSNIASKTDFWEEK